MLVRQPLQGLNRQGGGNHWISACIGFSQLISGRYGHQDGDARNQPAFFEDS
jgi:hypothetical protein